MRQCGRVTWIILALAITGGGALSAATADANDFTFTSFSGDYYLDVDAEGRSTLTTVETFVALFPEADQNRGMQRAIPAEYQDAPTGVEIVGVADERGEPRPFTVETDDEGFVIVTSAAEDFVRGEQTYVFTYTQKNVTRYFADVAADEFQWDTNGTGWDQPFAQFSARVHVPTELAASMTGSSTCYSGVEGSTRTCPIGQDEGPDGVIFEVSQADVRPSENVTIAIGFEAGTFVPRDDAFTGSPFGIAQALSVLIGLVAVAMAIRVRRSRLADGVGRATIIAEYAPPAGMDLFTAAAILGKTSRATAATILSLAVNRRIRIIETGVGSFGRSTGYVLELIDSSSLSVADSRLVVAIFGDARRPGSTYTITTKDIALTRHVQATIKATAIALGVEGIQARGRARYAVLPSLLVLVGALASLILGIVTIESAVGGGIPTVLMGVSIVSAAVVIGLVVRTPLTEKGAELRDHLKGLEMYIRLAEVDRLRVLQGPNTAETQQGVLMVYERLLPYAVLFNLEKQWSNELGHYYADESPDWYGGSAPFTTVAFASGISSLTSSAVSAYSGSSGSSSSGGSGGGGSSGGGGGGGGGGGV